jgi:MEMO1 family protein
MNAITTVRPPAVAGMFYPAEVAALRAEISRCLGLDADVATVASVNFSAAAMAGEFRYSRRSHLKALIVPHAGYVYSGPTAGKAYAEIAAQRDVIRRVVLLGPTHRVAVKGIAVPSVASFRTPFGDIPLDRAAIDALAGLPYIVTDDAPHAQEHSLEVHLPFLQTVLDNFSLIPLAVSQTSVTEVADLIDRLWGGDETLIVASSDLSHFRSYDDAQKIDGETAAHILNFELLTSFEQACGAMPINGLLQSAKRRGMRISRLAQCNSGDTAGDKSRVVGYASFGLYETPQPVLELGPALLASARGAIAAHFGQAAPNVVHAAYNDPGATFVTLTLNGQLRGCIGSLETHRPLGEDVRANALNAAFRDPRFKPISAEEFQRIKVEVSLLTKPVSMQFSSEADALAQLRPGIDGVILVAGQARSTYLPQVWEQMPEPRQFLSQLKLKAGLPADAWPEGIKLFRYEVQKWKE